MSDGSVLDQSWTEFDKKCQIGAGFGANALQVAALRRVAPGVMKRFWEGGSTEKLSRRGRAISYLESFRARGNFRNSKKRDRGGGTPSMLRSLGGLLRGGGGLKNTLKVMLEEEERSQICLSSFQARGKAKHVFRDEEAWEGHSEILIGARHGDGANLGPNPCARRPRIERR